MKLLHTSLIAALLFVQVPGKKVELAGVEMPIGGMRQDMRLLYSGPSAPLTHEAPGNDPQGAFTYSGGWGKKGALPIDKLLDEKLEPLITELRRFKAGTCCEHEWRFSEYTIYPIQSLESERSPLARLEQCKQCGLLRIKK